MGFLPASNREFAAELLAFAYTQTTVRVYPNNRLRTPKQLFAYTQIQRGQRTMAKEKRAMILCLGKKRIKSFVLLSTFSIFAP